MDAYAARLAAWLRERKLDAEHLVFEQSTHSVAEAARAANASAEDFVKSICMLRVRGAGSGEEREGEGEREDEAAQLIVAIVKGEDRASTTRVAQLVGHPVRLAQPAEMLALSGYPAGGTPPFGFAARFLVDERVTERSIVFAGGGSDRALVRVAPGEMLRANGGAVVRVRK